MTVTDTIPLPAGGSEPTSPLPPPEAGATPDEAVSAEAKRAGQVAALCWRLRKGRVQVLLVTSRDTGRWVLPKGWPMEGLGPEGAAAREAWEEAGVEGKVAQEAIGCFAYDKVLRDASCLPCRVDVFPLRVQNLKGRFPERKQRRRKWFSAVEAAGLVAEESLRALLELLSDEPARLAPAAGHKHRRAAA